jgi:hypothetical protein
VVHDEIDHIAIDLSDENRARWIYFVIANMPRLIWLEGEPVFIIFILRDTSRIRTNKSERVATLAS